MGFDGVDQVVLFTPDVGGALRLYGGHLGFEIVSREVVDGPAWGALWRLPAVPDRLEVTLLDKPGSRGGQIRLVGVPGMPPAAPRQFILQGLFAFDFYVRDVPQLFDELRADGYRFKSEPLTYAMPGAATEITECLLEGPQGIWHSFINYLPDAHRCLLASQPDQRVSEVAAVVQIVDNVDQAIDAFQRGLGGRKYYDQIFGNAVINRIVGLDPGSSFRVVLVRGATSRNARIELMSPVEPRGASAGAASPVLLSMRVEALDDQLASLRALGVQAGEPVVLAAAHAGGPVRASCVDLGANIRVELVEGPEDPPGA